MPALPFPLVPDMFEANECLKREQRALLSQGADSSLEQERRRREIELHQRNRGRFEREVENIRREMMRLRLLYLHPTIVLADNTLIEVQYNWEPWAKEIYDRLDTCVSDAWKRCMGEQRCLYNRDLPA